MSTLRLSHVINKVTDLHVATAELTAAGFTFAWGSEPGVAHNALVWFDEGPFLEAFQFDRLAGAATGDTVPPAFAARFRHWISAAPGWCDVALECDNTDLGATMARLRAAGVAASGTVAMSRTNPDGTVVSRCGTCFRRSSWSEAALADGRA